MSWKTGVWFKTARQVHQFLTCPLGEQFIYGDGETATKESGIVYAVSEKTIYNHAADEDGPAKLPRRRKGGFAMRTVETYARDHLSKVVDAAGEDPAPQREDSGAAVRRTMADADLKEIKAAKERLAFERDRGLVLPTSTVERELGERTQAFKLYLTAFMRDIKAELISQVGGDVATAREIIDLVGGDESKVEELSGWMFQRSPILLDLWRRRLAEALNSFARGEWYTEEMHEAWELFEQTTSSRAEEVALDLIALAGGDVSTLGAVLEQFDIRERGGAA
ncbi:hypothetical protein [Desulfovibrio oxyclinae]|uniref:hypothetical protein n=1 Tax=Desulfovibrio oxyclinae TaxID=63560 RepID=UPI000364DCAE|nr:hypothetical protein [Desulfovibrio oxyclinae]